MEREVRATERYHRQMKKLPNETRKRIMKEVEKLRDWPDTPNTKALKGRSKEYRLRVGDYRVRFRIEGQAVIVEEVSRRSETTYKARG